MQNTKFQNYLLDISRVDKKRISLQHRHYIHIWGIEKIIRTCYNEIKKEVKRGRVLKLLKTRLMLPKSTIDSWVHGYNPIPILRAYEILRIWKGICKKSKKEFDQVWENIFNNVKEYSIVGAGERVTLPNRLTKEIAYLTGFILADGYIKSEDKLLSTNRPAEYSICLYDKSKRFLGYSKRLFKEIFGVEANLYFSKDKKGSWYTLRCSSKPIHRFFSNVIRIQEGDKTGKIDVPSIIKKASIDIQKAFIAGFFDGEVGIGISTKGPWLEIAQVATLNNKPLPILLWTKKRLKEMGIILNGPTPLYSKYSKNKAWRLRTASQKVINKFYKTIPLRYKEKIKICKEIGRFSYAG